MADLVRGRILVRALRVRLAFYQLTHGSPVCQIGVHTQETDSQIGTAEMSTKF